MGSFEIVYNDGDICLVRGDCRDYLPTLTDSSIGLILSDPPYGHNNNNGDLIHSIEQAFPARKNKRDYDKLNVERRVKRKDVAYESRPIANDGEEANELVKWTIQESKRLLVKGGNLALCCSGGGGPGTIEYANWSIWMDQALKFKQMVIWDKASLGIGLHFRRNYEVVLVATKPGSKCKWYDTSRKVPNVVGIKQGIPKILPKDTDHPTPKPVELMKFFINLFTEPGDIVLDPFAGHAPVGVACKILGRKYIGVEIDPDFCQAAVNRIVRKRQGMGWELEVKK